MISKFSKHITSDQYESHVKVMSKTNKLDGIVNHIELDMRLCLMKILIT